MKEFRMDSCKILLLIAIVSGVSSPTSSAPQKDIYRLPTNCTPSHYELSLILSSQIFSEDFNEFAGAVTISFQCSTSGHQVHLHADKKFINIETLRLDDFALDNESYSIDPETDILRISSKQPIEAGKNKTLAVTFTGKINNDASGLYKSDYLDDNKIKTYLLSTHFESTYARRMFPCFDEPNMKATFDVDVAAPKTVNVFFNTKEKHTQNDGTRNIISFKTTPLMSTYVLAMVAAKYDCTEAETVNDVPFRVCSRFGTANWRELAKKFAPKALSKLNEFTGLNYGDYAEKMDLIAVPDLYFGAMENWGLATFRENYLLWDANESSNAFEEAMVNTFTHELAHQWFGNLVTLQWWSETFLNEGFATYFEYYTTKEIRPDWELEKKYVVDIVQEALREDGQSDAKSLNSKCSTRTEINSKFDEISYCKGGSILNMVKHFMGESSFKEGLRSYLNKYKKSVVTSQNLWNTLQEYVMPKVSKLPASLTEVMKNWIEKPGYPVLHVQHIENEIIISQKRLVKGEDPTKWFIPISYTISTTSQPTPSFESTSPDVWLIPKRDLNITVPNDFKWIMLNNKVSAYYRVNYDDSIWNQISDGLKKQDFDGIPEVNRAQIVDDLFSLAETANISKALKRLDFLSNDESYYTWRSAFKGFENLLAKTLGNVNLRHAVQKHVQRLMDELYKSVSTSEEENHIYTLKRSMALEWACKLGNEECIQLVRQLFKNYTQNNTSVPKDIKDVVYCNAVRYSKDTSDWEFLWRKYLLTDLATEQTTILKSLSCTQDPELINRYLRMTTDEDSKLRKQDGIQLFSWISNENTEKIQIVLDFLIQNCDHLLEKYQTENTLGDVIEEMSEYLSSQKQVQKLIDFKKSREFPKDFNESIDNAIDNAKDIIEWLEKFEDELEEYYGLSTRTNTIQQ